VAIRDANIIVRLIMTGFLPRSLQTSSWHKAGQPPRNLVEEPRQMHAGEPNRAKTSVVGQFEI
jgi:hypothetical protein